VLTVLTAPPSAARRPLARAACLRLPSSIASSRKRGGGIRPNSCWGVSAAPAARRLSSAVAPSRAGTPTIGRAAAAF